MDKTLEFIIAITFGLAIELFFRTIRYYSEKNIGGPTPKYIPYNNYISVSEYVSGGQKRWLSYFIFRNLPPLIIFIFSTALYQKYFFGSSIHLLLILTAITSLLSRDLYRIIKSDVLIQEKIVHILNCSSVIGIAIAISSISMVFPLGFLAPSLPGIVDNLWSALLVVILVVLYVDATNQQTRVDENKKTVILKNYVVKSYNSINLKYGPTIQSASLKDKSSKSLIYAVLIHENMNRPEIVRKLENFIVKIFGLRLSVGIAQVKSKIPLSNEQSIMIGSRMFKNTDAIVSETFNSYEEKYLPIKDIIKIYNPSTKYIDSVIQILSILRLYFPDLYSLK